VIPVTIQAIGKHCKLIQKIPQQHTRKAQNQGATKEAILGTNTTQHNTTHTDSLSLSLSLSLSSKSTNMNSTKHLTWEITLHLA
jgi:hypothetical protein